MKNIGQHYSYVYEILLLGVAFLVDKKYDVYSHEGDFIRSFSIAEIETLVYHLRHHHGIEAGFIDDPAQLSFTFAWQHDCSTGHSRKECTNIRRNKRLEAAWLAYDLRSEATNCFVRGSD